MAFLLETRRVVRQLWRRLTRQPMAGRDPYVARLLHLFREANFEDRSDADLMADFRHVFFRDDDGAAGRRVLYSILAWGGFYADEPGPIDPNELQRAQGRRDLAAHVARMTFAPIDRSDQSDDDVEEDPYDD